MWEKKATKIEKKIEKTKGGHSLKIMNGQEKDKAIIKTRI